MHRIDHATAAPGNLFTEGNPATATPATTVTDDWLNDVQENVCEVVEYAGIALVKGTPTQLRDAILNMVAAGGAIKTPVRAATTADIANLAGGAPSTLDGVALSGGDRILVKNQATASQNGIYIVTTLGSGANGTWARATDADGVGELTPGMIITVAEGNTYPDTVWELATNGAITIGTTGLTFQWAGGLIGLTQAQFDNSTKLATTEFVKRNGLQFSRTRTLSGAVALDVADAGSVVIIGNATGYTVTLPAVATFTDGASIDLVWSSNNNTVQRAGADTIIMSNSGSIVNSVLGNSGDTLRLTKYGSSWFSESGSLKLKYAGVYGNSHAASGYQKLPSGLILQWGVSGSVNSGSTAVSTLPIAFPNAGLRGFVTLVGAPVGSSYSGSVSALTTTQITIGHYASGGAAALYYWFAIGY